MYKLEQGGRAPGYRKWAGKWWWTGMVAFGFLLSVFLWGQAALAGPTAPGSESDPLVTESWVRAYFSGGGGGNDQIGRAHV